jgi:hypothetical protein
MTCNNSTHAIVVRSRLRKVSGMTEYGGMDVKLHAFLTLALDAGEQSASRS